MFLSKRGVSGFVLLFAAVCLVFSFSFGREGEETGVIGAQRPLAEILNPDGSLKVGEGLEGSFDPRGFRMVSGPGGKPLFVPEGSAPQGMSPSILAAGDENWDSQFGNFYTNGFVYAIAVSGTDVYVGGAFTQAGGNPANRIAKWNMETGAWSALGSGVNHYVLAIAVSGTDVYVGGLFTQAGGNDANRIAKWNGSAWSALGSGVNDYVSAIAISGTDVYVGGSFTVAGGYLANHIAKWNGSAWSALGGGVNDYVKAIAISGTDVYVGGNFTWAGGNSANYIAKWNGSAWSALGSGVNHYVVAIAVSGTDVYVGGIFTKTGGNDANRIAKWNGSAWSALGSGVDTSVLAIAVSGTDVYVGGRFTEAGGNSANYIAKWNGSAWSALGGGVNNTVSAIAVSGTDVYVGGLFTQAGGNPSYYIGRWMIPLAVISPNGGEIWEVGSNQNITWMGSAGPVKIEYSRNNGSTWTTIAASAANTGSYPWTVPNTPSTQCLVRISDASDGDPVDTSDATFTITGLQVTSPNGGEQWISGSSQTITWTTVGSYPTVKIELSTDNGSTWTTITSGTTNTGSFPWTVAGTVSPNCLIKVSDSTDGVPSDVSNAVFSIVPLPSITVTRPNGGESWAAGTTYNVTWTQTSLSGTATIDLYKGGAFLKTLGTALSTSGTYAWAISATETPGSDYKVQVGEGAVSDQSDGNFSITVATYTISGVVTYNGSGLQNVVMAGLPGNPSTNASGNYTATVDYNWSGTATPALSGYTFTPESRTYTNVTSNQTAQDYTAAVTISMRNSPDQHQILPEVTWAQASGGGTWVTEIQITSFSPDTNISVYFDSQAGMRGPIALTAGLGQNCSVLYTNILSTLQTLDGGGFPYYGNAGALRFQTQSEDKIIHVQARLRNGNYGKTTQGLSRHDSNVVRYSPTLQRGVIQGLTNDATFRTFVGFYNSSADWITIEFRVIDPVNETVGSTFSKTIPGWGFVVFNPFVEAGRPYPTYSYTNCWLWINPTSGDGKAMGFGSLTNNYTNDTYELVMVQFQ